MRLPGRLAVASIVLACCTLVSRGAQAYALLGYTWPLKAMTYYINPANLDLPEADVATAIRSAADAWAVQSGSSFRFNYAGLSTQTTNTFDSVNLVLFRNAASGNALATTYTWFSGSRIVDADTVFWDAGFRFFTGTSGCSAGFFVEDVMTHEFGHSLGLGHSASTAATMYPSISSCSQQARTLDADDIAAVLALYPAEFRPPAPPTGLRIIR